MKTAVRLRNLWAALVLVAVLGFGHETGNCATIIVRADGTSDYPTIQAAIDDSNDGDIVMVYPGTYTGDGNRDIDFLGKAITVRSTDPNNPEIVAATIIDCNGGMWPDNHRGFYFHNNEDANSILAGVTITNGSADLGGGIRCYQSSPKIINCTFTGNSALWAPFNLGSGMYNERGSSPILTNCTFVNNSAHSGGGIFNGEESSPTLEGCTFIGNSAMWGGGGVCNSWDNSLTLHSCTFTENQARYGGGMYAWGTEANLINCLFTGNQADLGGAISNAYSIFKLTNCILRGNLANEWGGAAVSDDSDVNLVNCTFSGNSAPKGSALACDSYHQEDPSNLQITNCILWDGGSEVWNNDGSTITITYSDVEGGWPDEGNIDADPCFAFETDCHLMSYSPCVDRGTNTPVSGLPQSDLDGNPRPLDGDGDGNSAADMGAYEYNPASPSIAVSAFDLSFVKRQPETVQTLQLRNCGGGVLNWQIVGDCNWVEVVPPNGVSTGEIDEVSLTVDSNGLEPGYHSCILSVVDQDAVNSPIIIDVTVYILRTLHVPADFNTIQAAIDAAEHYETVIVAPGTYTGDGNRHLRFKGKPITVRSTDPNDPNIVASTIIDCNGTQEEPHQGFYFHSGEDANSIVDGLTITNGYAPWWEPPPPYWWEPPPGWSVPGGGIYCEESGPTIRNCIITGNAAVGGGGGIYGSSGPIVNCVISRNSHRGLSECSGPITNCIISGNIGGGLVYCTGPITNCIITGNKGGGIFCLYGPVSNCTISDNGGPGMGGAFNATVANCIFWGNKGPDGAQIYLGAGDIVSIGYSDVQGGEDGVYVEEGGALDWAAGNIDSDPRFIGRGYWADANDPNIVVEHNDVNAVWVGGDYSLLRSSPCVDAGDNNGLPADITDLDGDGNTTESIPWDIEGKPRIIEGIPDGNAVVDMGAYETVTETRTHYVDADANGANDGSSWEDAFNYFQDALWMAMYSDQILVAEGIYKPDCNTANPIGTGDRTATFQLIKGVMIKGGYAGFGEADPNTRDVELYESILSGDLAGNDIKVNDPCDLLDEPSRSENSYHVVVGGGTDASAVLDGFTLTAGNANSYFNEPEGWGAGMCNLQSSARVINCRFSENSAQAGGAMFNPAASGTLVNCTFTRNYANFVGGGIYNGSNPIVANCTFSGNSAGLYGGGMYNHRNGSPTVTNCIFWGNTDQSGMGEFAQIFTAGGAPVITFNCIQDNNPNDTDIPFGGASNYNIDDNPCFVEPGYWDSNGVWVNGDYRLLPDSPCIDAGDNDSIPADTTDLDGDGNTTEPIPFDLDGNPRMIDGDSNGTTVVDMGAYEFWPPVQCELRILPRVINRYSRMGRVMAWVYLPEGITRDEIDSNEPLMLYPEDSEEGIEAVRQYVLQRSWRGSKCTSVFAFFDKGELMDAVDSNGRVELQVVGALKTGQYFYGSDTVRIIGRRRGHRWRWAR